MQFHIFDTNYESQIINCDWKQKSNFRAKFQDLLNKLKNQKIMVVVETKSLKMFHTHFSYKDLLAEFNVIMKVLSLSEQIIWTYSPDLIKWIKTSLKQKGLYFRELDKALRNSQESENPARFKHTLRVIETAWNIMKVLDLSEEIKLQVLIACAYHDFAKNWKLEKLKQIFEKKCNTTSSYPDWALHGPVAAYVLKDKNLVKNPIILRAIKYHTIPPKRPSVVGEILIIADKLEPLKRDNFADLIFQQLWNHLNRGEYKCVYKYLVANEPLLRRAKE